MLRKIIFVLILVAVLVFVDVCTLTSIQPFSTALFLAFAFFNTCGLMSIYDVATHKPPK